MKPPAPTMHEKLGQLIRDFRKAENLSIRDLESRSGVCRSVLSKLENAQGSATLATVAKVAEALNVKLSELIRSIE